VFDGLSPDCRPAREPRLSDDGLGSDELDELHDGASEVR